MEKSQFFKKEIENIESEDLREFVRYYLNEYVPPYFWEIGASSSGKYHPQFAQGLGGLVRHTKATCLFAEELLRMSSYAYMLDEFKDYVRVACIVHDTCKYGMGVFDKEQYAEHSVNASNCVNACWFELYNTNAPEFLLSAIRCHMGQWSERENRPFTNIDRCVHMADYMASRNFIDIPQIVEEYNAVFENERAESEDKEKSIDDYFNSILDD